MQEYFANSKTRGTVTGKKVGLEVETMFVDADTHTPILSKVSHSIRYTRPGRPRSLRRPTLELGRHNIEIAPGPATSFAEALEMTAGSLSWLYETAAQHNAVPLFAPYGDWAEDLLDESTDPRDKLWLNLDGKTALEQLCRCASVQFTVDVHPADAVGIINELRRRGVHQLDYAENDRQWQLYISTSQANYRPDRYGGPEGFEDLSDYCHELTRHNVVMHRGRMVNQPYGQVRGFKPDLFLRSVWWHFRLRVYGADSQTLALECRPFARRTDADISAYWQQIAPVFGL
jgi:hypothetical protein